MTEPTPEPTKLTPDMLASAIVCYSKCWPCQFGQCQDGPHTWMDAEDIEFSKDVQMPKTPEDWAALATSHPCGCHCPREADR